MAQHSSNSQEIGFCHTLRVFAAFTVVLAHVVGGTAESLTPLSLSWWICITIFASCFWSVPIFVMISGLLLLNPKRQESLGQFYRRRLQRLGIPVLVWTILYLPLRFKTDSVPFSAMASFNFILAGRPYAHLWFLYMLIGLYLLTPFLRTFVQVTPRPQRIALIMAGLILGDAYHLTNMMFWGNSSSIFTMFIPFISYYLLGYELSLAPARFQPKYIGLAIVATIGYLATLIPSFIELRSEQYGLFFFSFFGPPIALSSLVLFVLGQRWHPRLPQGVQRWMTRLSSTTLGIYALHIAVLLGLQKLMGGSHKQPEVDDLAIALIVGPLLAFFLSAGITAIILRIPLLRRTVG